MDTKPFIIRSAADIAKIPKSLHTIIFGHYFNQSVDKLPESLHTITFGYDFNQSVDKLPESLHTITFGGSFNHFSMVIEK